MIATLWFRLMGLCAGALMGLLFAFLLRELIPALLAIVPASIILGYVNERFLERLKGSTDAQPRTDRRGAVAGDQPRL